MSRQRKTTMAALAAVALHAVWNVVGIGGPFVTTVFGDAVLTIAPAVAGVACLAAGFRMRFRDRRAWLLLGAACLAWAAGDAVWAYYEVILHQEVPFPSLADVGFLGLIPLSAAAVLTFPAGTATSSRIRTFADGLILAASILFVSWATVLGPTVRAGADNTLATVVAIAYPLGDVVIMTAVLFVLARAPRGSRTPFALIGSGLLALAVADTGFLYLTASGLYSTGSLVDVAWTLGFVLLGLATVRSADVEADQPAVWRPRAGAVALPYLGVGVAIVTASVLWARNGTLEQFLFWNTVGIVVLVAGRQLLALVEIVGLTRGLEATVDARTAQLRASEQRFRSLVQNSSDVVTVVDTRGVVAYQSDSVESVFGYAPDAFVGLRLDRAIHPSDVPGVRAALAELTQRSGGSAQLEFRLRHASGRWRDVDATVCSLIEDPNVNGLVLNVRDVTERKALESQLTHQAFHDSLTSLPNRALFADRLQGALHRAARHGSTLAVLYVDLDGFKGVNDMYGHEVGDQLLVRVAELLRDVARSADTVARFGGDEFAILVEEVSPDDLVVRVAERILEAFETPHSVAGKELHTRASIGIAMSEAGGHDAGELIGQADAAMYVAKNRGRRRFEIFDPEMHAAIIGRLELESDLRVALERDELAVHYQPVVDLATGQITGTEALMRWDHPIRGAISPIDFIPVAEESGLILEMGAWILEEAVRQARAWQDAYPWHANLTVSVNVSVLQLHEAGFVDAVAGVLARQGLSARSLVLEITESMLLDQRFDSLSVLHALKRLGVGLAIDDFGTGYSSLGYLRDLPVDTLKIDRSFVRLLGTSPEDSALARAIVHLGRTLHLRTVAEGVEEQIHRDELVAVGCDLAQGFLYSRPVTAPALGILLGSGRPLPDPDPMTDMPEPVEAIHVRPYR